MVEGCCWYLYNNSVQLLSEELRFWVFGSDTRSQIQSHTATTLGLVCRSGTLSLHRECCFHSIVGAAFVTFLYQLSCWKIGHFGFIEIWSQLSPGEEQPSREEISVG
jgi:hypothetical protein